MVRAYGTLLGLVLRRGAVLRALKRAVAELQLRAAAAAAVHPSLEARVARGLRGVRDADARIRAEQARAEARRAVAAFVTFRDEAGKEACLRAQPRSRMRQWWSLRAQHRLRGR